MIWNTLSDIFNTLVVPVMAIFFFAGLLTFVSGIEHVRKGMYREQRFSWYEYPNVLIGLGIMFVTLFFSLCMASGYTSTAVLRIIMDVMAVVCAGLALLCLVRARQRTSLLRSKGIRPEQATPKD